MKKQKITARQLNKLQYRDHKKFVHFMNRPSRPETQQQGPAK